jgi:hypothetical protein
LKIGHGEIIRQNSNELVDEVLFKIIEKINTKNKNPDITPGMLILEKLGGKLL